MSGSDMLTLTQKIEAQQATITTQADQLKIACEHIRILHGMVLGTENYDSRMTAACAFLKEVE